PSIDDGECHPIAGQSDGVAVRQPKNRVAPVMMGDEFLSDRVQDVPRLPVKYPVSAPAVHVEPHDGLTDHAVRTECRWVLNNGARHDIETHRTFDGKSIEF